MKKLLYCINLLLLLAQIGCITSPKGEIQSVKQVANTDTLNSSNFDKSLRDTQQIITRTKDSVTSLHVKKKYSSNVNDTIKKNSVMPHVHPTVKGLEHIKDSLDRIKKRK